MDGADVSYPGADGGEVGGSSQRERYSVPGTAPLRKRSVVSFHFSATQRKATQKISR